MHQSEGSDPVRINVKVRIRIHMILMNISNAASVDKKIYAIFVQGCRYAAGGLKSACSVSRVTNTNPETILVYKYSPIIFLLEELMTICLTDF